MANSWFQFKQFRIEQSDTAMKVGTDGVLLGAWADMQEGGRILDIGTGTGLIALMLAQRNLTAQIIGVELDSEASLQAKNNFKNSKWTNRLSVEYLSIQDFTKRSIIQYDTIVSNPPYFNNSIDSKDTKRQLARQTNSLSFEELLDTVLILLKETGVFSVILPYFEGDKFIEEAELKRIFLYKRLNVYPTNRSKEPKRVLLSFSKKQLDKQINSLIIEPEIRHDYSREYKDLTKDFYLKF